MFRFFNKCSGMQGARRMYFVSARSEFKMKNPFGTEGSIYKILVNKDSSLLELIESTKNILKQHPNSVFIFTTNTKRLHGAYGEVLYPGHNCIAFVDQYGEIEIFVSKRPDTNRAISTCKLAPDVRFWGILPSEGKIYESMFTTFDEEMCTIFKRVGLGGDFSLFLHTLPLTGFGSSKMDEMKNNAKKFLEAKEPYALNSMIHPSGGFFTPAQNCNNSIQHVIHGCSDELMGTHFCSHATAEIIMPFVDDKEEYVSIAEKMGFFIGVEKSPFQPEDFMRPFTC